MNTLVLAVVLQISSLLQGGVQVKINRPSGSYQTLIEWKEKDKDFNCLVYKVPLVTKRGSNLGELFILKNKVAGCSIGKGEKEFIQREIEGLVVRNISSGKGLRFELIANNESTYHFDFPFVDRRSSRWPELYPYSNKEVVSQGKLKSGEVCLKRSQSCRREGEYSCHRCRGWTPFINLNCSEKISGICGTEVCGARGQRACLKMTTLGKIFKCEELKPFVYCRYGLEVECQSNGEVICR